MLPLPVGLILLAAGASRRMGRPKLLLPWADTTVLGHLLSQWRALNPAQITVVCAKSHAAIQDELDRLEHPLAQRIFNPDPYRGMFSSIQCAASWSGWQASLRRWVVSLGDQPLVQTETLRRLLDYAAVHPEQVCQPSRNGRSRHPVILPRRIFLQLKDSSAENLKQFLEQNGGPVAKCEIDDPGLNLDLDAPADYELALRTAGIPAGKLHLIPLKITDN
jgi:molybdenum cofactor cytidylyltransferase